MEQVNAKRDLKVWKRRMGLPVLEVTYAELKKAGLVGAYLASSIRAGVAPKPVCLCDVEYCSCGWGDYIGQDYL